MKKLLFVILCAAVYISAQDQDPLIVGKRIADRIISETRFETVTAAQKPSADVQVIDFQKAFVSDTMNNVYAIAYNSMMENKELKFGISYSSPVNVWINGRQVFGGREENRFEFKEIAYSIFVFNDTIKADLRRGENTFVVESAGRGKAKVYLREITLPEERPASVFVPCSRDIKNYTWPWCFVAAGKIKIDVNNIPADIKSGRYMHIIPGALKLKKLASNPNSTYKKDSFADWNYPNGILMMSLAELSEKTGDEIYGRFVKKYCNFIKDNMQQFGKQYYEDNDLRGSFYRMFRKSMLDDAGAPALPFAETELNKHIDNYDKIINEMADYIMNRQTRLQDGTLCRPEPEEWTVWADDLFMSVPLLLRVAILRNDDRYFNEASKQLINFNKYLYDKSTGLYQHGWFSRTDKKSGVFWGRANGWVIWATSEALKYLPEEIPSYNIVKRNFIEHLNGVLACQDKDGMWHQVLDDKTSFEETSCTAMFIIGLSRAVTSGLLNKDVGANIFKAWDALQSRIGPDRIVKDICCGTGIGFNKEFYKERKRYDNDPRGLGAVITAAAEVSNLQKYLQKNR